MTLGVKVAGMNNGHEQQPRTTATNNSSPPVSGVGHNSSLASLECVRRLGVGRRPRAVRRGVRGLPREDLKDGKFNRLEAAGIDAAVRGLSALLKDDRKLLRQSGVIFDGLYALPGDDAGKDKGKGDGGKRRERGARGRKKRA